MEDSLSSQLKAAADLLEKVADNREILANLSIEDRTRLLKVAGNIYCPDLNQRRVTLKLKQRRERAEKRNREEKILSRTGIRSLRRKPIFTTPNSIAPSDQIEDRDLLHDESARSEKSVSQIEEVRVDEARNCYICKKDYLALHHFYDQLCPPCAEFNFQKRGELANLKGRVALLTGGRVKIGYQAGIKLLRSGAHLIVTTRFPRDSALRYANEPDFGEWGHRLEIYGLDLRHTPSVEAFCSHILKSHHRLDFIINNACQTVRRPPEFYEHMMNSETAALSTMPEQSRRLLGPYEGLRETNLLSHRNAASLSQIPLLPEERKGQRELFPKGQLDQDLQQVDLRESNSWRLMMAEVSSVELIEVQLVNAVAPFIINARLKPLLLRTPERDKHIVNVSAVEGQFYRRFKTTRHPHTNMAKAALNMMTRTAATDYFNDGIHMNAVDTGWVTDEDPAHLAEKKILEHRFHPPLDIVDGAARIVDPIIAGINTGEHIWGKFLKDYRPTDW